MMATDQDAPYPQTHGARREFAHDQLRAIATLAGY
jgi:hypothetical protein